MTKSKKVRLIGVPYLYGKDSPTRADAPQVLRAAGLYKALTIAGIPYTDAGDIEIGQIPANNSVSHPKFRYLSEVLTISQLVAAEFQKTVAKNEIPVVLGGDHSVAIGSLLGLAAQDDVTVIWIDTHGDFHTSETTISGRMHGMALALGCGLDPKFGNYFNSETKFFDQQKAILFAAQKFDPGEREAIEKHIGLIDMYHIVRYGIGEAVEELLKQITTKNIHISLDLDSIDKHFAPGTDMAIEGALTYREVIYTLERLAETHTLMSMDVVEFAPVHDVDNQTASLAIEGLTTALGSRVGAYELYMAALDQV